jgi:hypothetical protein
MKVNLRSIVLLVLAAMVATPPMAQEKASKPAGATGSGAISMEVLRQKLKSAKKPLIAANMNLTEAEAKAFWPIYEAYQEDLAQLNTRTGKAIVAYADAYNKGAVSNQTAKKLLGDFLAIEESELKLKRLYISKLEKVLPGAKVARYIQIEGKIRTAVKYELADAVPLVD